MKKAYVKLKPKSVKKTFKKAYIIAASVSALLCAFLFSALIFPQPEVNEEVKIETGEVIPDEISQVSESIEIEIPSSEEIIKISQPEIITPDEEVKEVDTKKEPETDFIMPVTGEIINDYSGSVPVKSKTMGDWRVHSGIDIRTPQGETVVAPASGKVIEAKNDRLTGKTVSIENSDGIVFTIYNLGSIKVSTGNKVKIGDIIGTSGQSAALEAQEEPHVHFEITKDEKHVNPRNYIN